MTELIKIDKAMVESFEINLIDVQKMVEDYQKLTLAPDDKGSYRICRTALTVCVRNRRSIDERRKELNAHDQDRIKKRNGVAGQLTDLISPAESHLTNLVKGEDNRIAVIKAEKAKIEQKRVDEIQELINGINSFTVSLHLLPDLKILNDLLAKLESIEINPDTFMEFTPEANASKHEVRITLIKAIDARKEFEAQEQALRAQNEEIEKQKAELEARAKEQDEKQAKIDAEKKKLEQEKFERDATEKAEDEAREKIAQWKKEKEEQEHRAKIEKDRLDALKPDLEKLNDWIKSISIAIDDNYPVALNNSNAVDACRSIQAKGDEFIRYAKERIKEL